MKKYQLRRSVSEQIKVLKKAYDRTVENFKKGVNDLDLLPEDFKNSAEFLKLQKAKYTCHSGSPDIKEYLQPKKGMNFLDVGCCANLINYGLDKWPSNYYGIDISPKLIKAVKAFVAKNKIKIGGLFVSEAAKMPFKNNFFDIAACIGVLEYFDESYICHVLRELHRVLKSGGRLVVDMPNLENQDVKTMFQLEAHLGRPRFNLPTEKVFEKELRKNFTIDKKDDNSLMVKYFVRRR